MRTPQKTKFLFTLLTVMYIAAFAALLFFALYHNEGYLAVIAGLFALLALPAFYIFSSDYAEAKRQFAVTTENVEDMSRLIDGLSSRIIITEMDSDIIVYVNSRMKKDFNLPDDVIGQKCWKAIFPEFNKRCDFCPKHNPEITSGKPIMWEFQPPGTNRYYRVISRASERANGKKVLLEQCDDITHIMESAAKMRDADEYTQLLLDTVPISCVLWNNKLEILDCNQETVVLFERLSKQDFIENFADCSPPYQPNGKKTTEYCNEKYTMAMETGYSRYEFMHKLPDGEPLPCEVTMVRLKHKGEFFIAAYTRDLREHKEYLLKIDKANESLRLARDAAEAANNAKTSFLANMSHEIRTPLNSIIGFSELAYDTSLPKKTTDYLSLITESAEWLLRIINDILDISKIESGKMELERIPFNLHDIFAHCHSSIQPKTEEKGITLYCYAEPSIGGRLMGDPTRLRQALLNILSNAVKFTNTGTVKLLASVKSSDENTVTILFEVKDSGIGMSPEQIDRIFEPFTQADGSITRKYGGTGLGLTITRNIIKMMGGQLKVESKIGAGSIFGFELTFDVLNDNTELTSQRVVFYDLEKPTFEGEVLVCEDNAMNQQVICEHLNRVGLSSVVANNGQECVDIVSKRTKSSEKPFDLIFMDIHMPVMDGLEAASKITLMGCKTPVVAMTANIMANDIEMYKANGMSDFLGKPFTSQELWKCLMKYFPLMDSSPIDEAFETADEVKMKLHLKTNFVKSNQTTYSNIENAVLTGDMKLAHRLAHTLKTNAAQIDERELSLMAAAAEASLLSGILPKDQLFELGAELKSVLEKLSPYLDQKPEIETLKSEDELTRLFNELEIMLNNRNPECMKLIPEINAIPNTTELARCVEEFEFIEALDALNSLRKEMKA